MPNDTWSPDDIAGANESRQHRARKPKRAEPAPAPEQPARPARTPNQPRARGEQINIGPQPGPQTQFLASQADIAIMGGSAGAGKSWCLLLEPLYHIKTVQHFGAVFFRRTTPQLRGEGGLWDTSGQIYPLVGGIGREADLEWLFPVLDANGKQIGRNRIKMSHLEHDRNRYDWDSTQIPLEGFDQLEGFSDVTFWHLVGRNRSTCGVRPYIRATCNPISSGWLHDLICSYWVGEDGYPIKERSGELRWMVRMGEETMWSSDRAELVARVSDEFGLPEHEVTPLSVTFIPGLPTDNKILMEKDPTYLAKLRALPRVERERLLHGNWRVVAGAGDYFQRVWCEFVSKMPQNVVRWVRSWDLAGTRPSAANVDPDWTVGTKVGLLSDQRTIIVHASRKRDTPGQIKQLVMRTAEYDGRDVRIILKQDPGQAGKDQVEDYVRDLRGYQVTTKRETGSKEVRAGPFSSAAEHGQVMILRGAWNEPFLSELENFPRGAHDDDMDSAADAYSALAGRGGRFRLMNPALDRPRPSEGAFKQIRVG